MKRRLNISIILVVLLAVAITCRTVMSQSTPANEPIAEISNSNGTVHCKKGSSKLWKRCENNTQLFENDMVKTGEGSTAFINFTDGSYVKILPLSRATISKPWKDNPSTLISVDNGRMWIKIDTEQDNSLFLIKTPDGIVRGNNTKAFIEVDRNNRSCIEIADGMAGVISTTDPDNEVFMRRNQKAAMAGGAILGEMEDIDDAGDETQEMKSCFPEPEKKQEEAPPGIETTRAQETPASPPHTEGSVETVDEETYIVIKTSTTIISTTPEPEQPEPEKRDYSDAVDDNSGLISGGTSSYESDSHEQEQPEEEIYLTLTGNVRVTFASQETEDDTVATVNNTTTETSSTTEETTADAGSTEPQENTETTEPVETTKTQESTEEPDEAEGPCEESPVFFDVTVSDEEVDDTGEVILDSELPCDLNATATIVWNTSIECGSIKSMSVGESSKAPTFFAGAGPGQVAGGQLEYLIRDNKPHEMMIKAEGDNGKISFFSFTAKVQGQSLSSLPEITGVTINNISVDEDSTVHVGSTSCSDDMPLVIKGSATSECGDIKEIELELDGTDTPVRGRDSWTFSTAYSDDETFPLVVRATDVSGRTSRDFEVEVELVREITQPYIEIETIGGEPVSTFGDPMELYRNDLVDGKLRVAGKAISDFCTITKVEASVDDASSWGKAEGGASWEYLFRPSDGDYMVSARAVDDAGLESEEMTNPIEMIYSTYTLEEKLVMAFEAMMQAYRDKDSDGFMEYVSPNYSSAYDSIEDSNRLDRALDDKFSEQTNIYIRYQESSHSISGTTGRVVFNWDAKQSTSGYSHSATFVYTKTREGWKFISVDDQNTFLRHTSVAAYIKASSDKSSLVADREDSAFITVEVRDSAYNPVKNGTTVSFSATTGTVPSSETTTEGIAEVEYVSGSTQGLTTITAVSGSMSTTVSITMIPEAPPGPPE